MDQSGWIVVAVIVALALLAALVMMRRGQAAQAHREEAADLREQAGETERSLKEREAHAAEVDAQARRARAEADARAAEAEKLELEREQRQGAVDSLRARHQETLAEADRIDPDIRDGRGDHHEDEAPRVEHVETIAPVELTRERAVDLGHEITGFDRDAYAQDGSQLRGGDEDVATAGGPGTGGSAAAPERAVTPQPAEPAQGKRLGWRDRLRRR